MYKLVNGIKQDMAKCLYAHAPPSIVPMVGGNMPHSQLQVKIVLNIIKSSTDPLWI